MCSIFGLYDPSHSLTISPRDVEWAQQRGRDSWGVVSAAGDAVRVVGWGIPDIATKGTWVIGNTRAEPTTEWVVDKTVQDVQPFTAGPLTLAHNGTFANDRQLATDAGVDLSTIPPIDTARWVAAAAARGVSTPKEALEMLDETVGSYGIALGHTDGWLLLAANYRPIWVRRKGKAWRFTSVAPRERTFLTRLSEGWQMLPPYSALVLREGSVEWIDRRHTQSSQKTLVVCSGGLDSTVAAAWAVTTYGSQNVDLLHITYGCRAESREVRAVQEIAARLGVGLRMLDLTEVFRAVGNSRLTGTLDSPIAEGEEGAEYASEWVPARNLILTSIAVGIAEGNGYRTLMLGNNIEEAGAYPDNESEFIGRISDLLPFAVADGREVRIMEPVGTLTKREIVELGIKVGAPLDLTWSCYHGGALHCGTCGPCYMRRMAFKMSGAVDPMRYEEAGER